MPVTRPDLAPAGAAPEVLKSRQYDAKLADVWSVGVMLFTMLCCTYPFERREDDEDDPRTQTRIMQRILKGIRPPVVQPFHSYRQLYRYQALQQPANRETPGSKSLAMSPFAQFWSSRLAEQGM